MRRFRPTIGALALITLVVVPNAAKAQVSVAELLDRCGKKTQVFQRVDGKLKVVGEQLDGFCEGFLLGAYDVLSAGGHVKAAERPSAEYLKSVIDTYRRDNPDKAAGPAGTVVRAALLRAFPPK